MTAPEQLRAIIAEAREFLATYDAADYPATACSLIDRLADRLEALASAIPAAAPDVARLRSERDEGCVACTHYLERLAALVDERMALRAALDELQVKYNDALASGIGAAGEAVAWRIYDPTDSVHTEWSSFNGGPLIALTPPLVERGCVVEYAYATPPARPSFDAGWKSPEPLSPEHPLECLIVLEAWRQSDGDWWMECSDSFIDGDRPLAYMADTPENRAALKAPPGTEGKAIDTSF
jgi:hypothetical protein